MYTSTSIGLGQQVTNQVSEEAVLRQLLNRGLKISSLIDDRRVDFYLSPDMAKDPYIPKRSAEAREYSMLSEHERKTVTDSVNRIFREATGMSRKLDPKNPKDLPWIRTWLRLRDQVMRRIRAKKTAQTVKPFRKYPPFRPSLGQPPKVSKNPWCNLSPPTCTTTRVSLGGYGTALLHYTDSHCIPNQVPQLLSSSPIFMRMVKELDKHYIAYAGPEICAHTAHQMSRTATPWHEEWMPNAAGMLTSGPFRGKRVLEVAWHPNGSYFHPAGSLDGSSINDVIAIQGVYPSSPPSPSPSNIAWFIANIAHETTHAYNMLQNTSPPPKTIEDRVKAAIADEKDTRKTEADIIAEISTKIPNTTNGKLLRNAFSRLTSSTDVWQIQRDFFPGEMKRTYLEHFVFSELALEAIRSERLQVDDIKRINEEIDRLEIGYKAAQSIKNSYGQWRHLLRGIDLNWKNLIKRLGSVPDNANPEKERLLRLHASRLNGLAHYDPNPRIP